jgi:hypothetical protein
MSCSLVVEWKITVEEKPVCAVVDISAFNHAHLKLFPNVISVQFILLNFFLRINKLQVWGNMELILSSEETSLLCLWSSWKPHLSALYIICVL